MKGIAYRNMPENFPGVYIKNSGEVYLKPKDKLWKHKGKSLVYIIKGQILNPEMQIWYSAGELFAAAEAQSLVITEETRLYFAEVENAENYIDILKEAFSPKDQQKTEGFFIEVMAQENLDIFAHSAYVYNFLMNAIEESFLCESTSSLVNAAIEMIQNEFNRLESIEQLADELGVSKHHLIREFSAQTGVSPGKYLENIRVDRAALLLRCTDYNLELVASIVGYTNANYFGKVFRKLLKTTPTKYRNVNKNLQISYKEKTLLNQLENVYLL